MNVAKARGVHPSEAMMHFPLFQIPPYFRKSFRLCGNFSKKCFVFHPPKFLMTFPPYFRFFSTFPPISGKLLFPPTF